MVKIPEIFAGFSSTLIQCLTRFAPNGEFSDFKKTIKSFKVIPFSNLMHINRSIVCRFNLLWLICCLNLVNSNFIWYIYLISQNGFDECVSIRCSNERHSSLTLSLLTATQHNCRHLSTSKDFCHCYNFFCVLPSNESVNSNFHQLSSTEKIIRVTFGSEILSTKWQTSGKKWWNEHWPHLVITT